MPRPFYLLIACPVLVILLIYFVSDNTAGIQTRIMTMQGEELGSGWSDVCPQYTVPTDYKGCIIQGPPNSCLTEFSGDPGLCVEYDRRPTTLHDCHDMYTFGYKKWAPESEQMSFQTFFELMCDLDDSDGLGKGWAHVCSRPMVLHPDGGCLLTSIPHDTCVLVPRHSGSPECIGYSKRPTTDQNCRDMYEYGYLMHMRDYEYPLHSDHEPAVSYKTFARLKCDL